MNIWIKKHLQNVCCPLDAGRDQRRQLLPLAIGRILATHLGGESGSCVLASGVPVIAAPASAVACAALTWMLVGVTVGLPGQAYPNIATGRPGTRWWDQGFEFSS